jgi:serine protease Do
VKGETQPELLSRAALLRKEGVMNRLKRSRWLGGVAALAVVSLLMWRSSGLGQSSILLRAGVHAAPSLEDSLPAPPTWSEGFARVADAVRPSVVFVRVDRRPLAARGEESVPEPFKEFFREWRWPEGDPPFRFFFGARGVPRIQQGNGSGFIISSDGHIITNHHVVSEADKLEVRLFDGRWFPAKVIGSDAATDVAVIKIDASDLPAARFGDSDDVRVGEWVLAIGNPMGEQLSFTVTAGIVSAKGRPLAGLPTESDYRIQDFIQTDAAINRGNSGGPLLNAAGEVIGVNAAMASQTGAYQGYGFAIPINLARRVAQELIEHGKVTRAILGLMIRPVDPEDAAYVGLDSISGVVVQGFSEPRSPAKEAGIQPGDVVVALDGRPIEYVAQLQQDVAFRKPGDVVTLTVQRKGGARPDYRVRLAAAPESEAALADAREGGPAEGTVHGRKLGIDVELLDDDEAADRGLGGEHSGLVVTVVDPDGPSAEKLLPRGALQGPDIITHIDGKRVRSVAELDRALNAAPSGAVLSLRTYNHALGAPRVVRIRVR